MPITVIGFVAMFVVANGIRTLREAVAESNSAALFATPVGFLRVFVDEQE